ncbi:MAG TPA: BON domain-containing protein [Pyrinomonadaceae bacterium]|nr:BON domain-containing protein [Pyrinomonadaceae bacterium]
MPSLRNGALAQTDGQQATPSQSGSAARESELTQAQRRLIREVRHELLTLPYYGVFDWIEYEVRQDDTVVLRGQVVSPPDTKSSAEAAVKDIEGVTRVINEIEVLPVSPNDDRLRRALYRAIFNPDSPLFRYGIQAVPSIHIIVKNGRATLKGIVANEADRNLAYMRARGVSGLFSVTNELQVEGAGPR